MSKLSPNVLGLHVSPDGSRFALLDDPGLLPGSRYYAGPVLEGSNGEHVPPLDGSGAFFGPGNLPIAEMAFVEAVMSHLEGRYCAFSPTDLPSAAIEAALLDNLD